MLSHLFFTPLCLLTIVNGSMSSGLFVRIFLLLITLLPVGAQADLFGQQKGFVPVDQAFGFDFSQQANTVTLRWQVKQGYYLYRQKISVEAHDASLGAWQLPQGKPHRDEFFGDSEIYPQDIVLSLPLTATQHNPTLVVTYQGCAAAGFCYPPETKTVPLNAVVAKPVTAPSSQSLPPSLPYTPLWALLIGIGVALTPCVLPMYPLISGIILGRKQQLSFSRTALLAIVYVQGMAITYTILGVVVAAAGLKFQAALQNPILLTLLSGLFILLALSMFGAFSLQLPASLQTRLALLSNKQRGGSIVGVLCMGILAGLICSPCTTAPLSAILLYIAQSGQVLQGAGTLYLYALGMGLPLILVTLFGNKLLPRSGPWMQTVKEGFGFVILALPVFLLERVLGEVWGERLWALLAVSLAGWAFILSVKSTKTWGRWLALVWLVLAVIAARPLQEALFTFTVTATVKPSAQQFTPIANRQELEQKLNKPHQSVTMLDLYADWCVACKEFEKYTFSDPKVQQAMSGMQRLQANVTKNQPQDVELLSSLKVLGLPTLLFFDAQGQEIPHSRITGFLPPEAFIKRLPTAK
ncbi:Thiol:disulfide interchange protein DsbD [Rosenbergiella nectarea]|uniref:Thiol:disulfide interchange protein DsbD n=2 Tax=Rosenbergiella nectarea TaxID=988801 RepID=A0A1H9DJA2_9GAMM|nr:Thiol:disulfide interchange protein DsbD [Rosenbergiella nectarea]